MNGRRHVGGDSERPNVVDLNSIPTALIERVDVVTGGLSAVYGSEAVAGVVNIITKDDFTGVTLDSQWGQSSEGDGTEKTLSLTAGTNFNNSPVHFTVNASYTDVGEVYSRDRGFSANDEFLGDFQDYSIYTPQGTITADGVNFFTAGDDGLWTDTFDLASDGYNRAEERLLRVPLKRESLALDLRYDITDKLSAFTEASWVKTKASAHIESTGAGLAFGHLLASDHPSIPPEALATLTSFYGELPEVVSFSRRLSELGARVSELKRETQRFVFGLEGDISDWQWDVYYQWGRSERDQQSDGNYNLVAFQNGLDVEADPDNAGQFRCIDVDARAAGCVPIDVFGLGSVSAAAANYIAIDSFDSSQINQEVFAATLRGGLPNVMPADEDIALAVGYEWREERMKTAADPFALAEISSSANITSAIRGEYEVSEVFAELRLPIINQLSVDTAYRLADYDTVGTHGSWHVGLDFVPTDLIRFRVMRAESARAPNVAELYDPGTFTFVPILDPCINGGTGGTGSTETNCASLGIPSDFDPGFAGGEARALVSGNVNLSEERADTRTIGFVLTPLKTLSVSMDYFDIAVDDAIENMDPQYKLNQCYASANFPNSPFCNGVVRDDVNFNYLVARVDFSLQNTKTNTPEFIGLQWDLSGNVTRTNKWETSVLGTPATRYEEPGFQKWKANTQLSVARDALSFTWATRYLGHGVVDNNFDTTIWPDNDSLPSVTYHDFNLAYAMTGGSTDYTLYVGLNNAFDKQPPYIPTPSVNNVLGSNTAAGVYDVVGRFMVAGVTVAF